MTAASRPSLGPDGATLWVNQQNRIEAYRNGRPLGIDLTRYSRYSAARHPELFE
jgi:hypothetical protein